MSIFKSILFISIFIAYSFQAKSQDNYEIQVYGSSTMDKGKTMVELHSNFAINGNNEKVDGVVPSHHALHETIEITHGFNQWFEVGFYLFNAVTPSQGIDFAGSHIRPRVRVPDEWNLPVGLSLSTEFGYMRPLYSEDSWQLEIRPIIDKTFFGKLYVCYNPVLDKSLKGMNQNETFVFSSNFKIGYKMTNKIIPGIEYYGSHGPLNRFDEFQKQQQQIVPCIDLNLSPDWEFNFGAIFGVTDATDKFLLKMIIGRKF